MHVGAWVLVCVCMCVLAETSVCGFSFCACFSRCLHMPGCPHVHACTQDAISSARVDPGLGSNVITAFPVLSPIRPECSLFHLSLPSLTQCPALLSAMSSESEDSSSKEVHTSCRTRQALHLRADGYTQILTSTKEGEVCREGLRWGALLPWSQEGIAER